MEFERRECVRQCLTRSDTIGSMEDESRSIICLTWDDWNLEHITKHLVTPEEAEEVALGFPHFTETYKNRLLMTGPTRSGRFLTVVIGEDPNSPGVYYVFSVRSASRRERRA